MDTEVLMRLIRTACQLEAHRWRSVDARRWRPDARDAWGFTWEKVDRRMKRRCEPLTHLERYARFQARKYFSREYTRRLCQDEPQREKGESDAESAL